MPIVKRMPLHLLISLSMVASLLVLSLVLVTVSYQNAKSTLVDATESAAGNAGTLLDGHLDRLIQPVQAAVRQLQFDPLSTAEQFDQRIRRLPVLAQTLNSNQLLSAVYAGYPDGDFLLLRHLRSERARNLVDAPAGSAYLMQSVERDGDAVRGSWWFLDRDLTILARQPRPDYRFDPRTRPWYQGAERSDETVLTQPYLFFTTAEIGITLALQTPGGSVLGMDASVEDLSGQMLDLPFTSGTRVALVDGDSQVVGHPDLSRIVVETKDMGPRLAQLTELDEPSLERVARESIDANNLVDFNLDGRQWYGLWAPLSTFTDADLRMLLAIPANELLDGAMALLLRQLGWSALIVLVALPLGWWIGRRIGLPLDALTQQVAALSRFDFKTRIGVDSRVREVYELGTQTARMAAMINSFSDISHNLNRATNLDRLLEQVLIGLVEATEANFGAVYLYDTDEKGLRLSEHIGFDEQPAAQLSSEPGQDEQQDAVLKALDQPGQSVMVTPLLNREEAIIGVLALGLPERAGQGEATFRRFVDRLAGSVALAIETRQLVRDQNALIEGIIKILADAIDTKSPYTGGHCDRVPQLATILLDRVEAAREGPFADFQLTDAERYEFTIAAWLHDCGKVVTPEYIVDKATKLEALHNRIHEVRMRFEVLWRDAELDYWAACQSGEDAEEQAKRLEEIKRQLQDEFAFLANMNIGGETLSDDDIERMHRIGDRTWQRHFSDRLGLSRAEQRQLADYPEPALPAWEKLLDDKPEHRIPWENYVPPVEKDHPDNRWGFDMQLPEHTSNRGERYNLSIRRGTLTGEERFQVNNHIVETLKMLTTLPWPAHLKRVPDIAANHHERMDGKGYPRRLTGEQMSISERVMAIADVFEALTAADRPYKPPKTLSESLSIMLAMGRDGHLDRDLLRLFIETRAYRVYAQGFLKPEQMDEVDDGTLLQRLEEA